MGTRAFLQKVIPFIRRGRPAGGSNPLNDKFYEHLSSKDKRLAEAARDVNACLAGGNFSRALAICDNTLSRCPGHPLFEGLRLEVEDRERQSRLEYVQRLSADFENIPDLETRIGLLEQALGRFPSESQLEQLLGNSRAKRDLVNSLLDHARDSESCDKPEDALEQWYTLRECHPLLPGLHAEIHRLESMLAPESGADSLRPQTPEEGKGISQALRMDYGWLASRKSIIAIAIAGVLGVGFLGYALNRRAANSRQAVAPTALNIAAFPEGAEILVDGQSAGRSQLQTTLPPGEHQVSVLLAGYQPQTVPVTLDSAPRTLNVTLQPIPLDLRIVTDRRSGRVWLDDEPKGDLSPEGVTISGVAPGAHRLKVTTPEGEVSTTFDFQPQKPPLPISLPARRTPAVLFVGSSNERSRIECNCAPALLKISDSQRQLETGGLELELLEGEYEAELSVMGGKRLVIQGSRAPFATVGLYWGEAAAPTVDSLLRDANTMLANRQYQAALAKVSQALSRSPDDDRALILRKRLERLMVIDP